MNKETKNRNYDNLCLHKYVTLFFQQLVHKCFIIMIIRDADNEYVYSHDETSTILGYVGDSFKGWGLSVVSACTRSS